MKKPVKILWKVLLGILGIGILVVLIGVLTIRAKFLNFDKEIHYDIAEISLITIDGYSFRDLNGNGSLDLYEDGRLSLDDRADDLLSQMTAEEKIRMLKGSGLKSAVGLGDPSEGIRGSVGTILPIPRLGIPTVYLSDGPAGLRIHPTRKNDDNTYYCTAFPIGTLLASTWNTELVQEVGSAMGNEALEYGIDVILAPGANIHRNPLCGRNFEYYSEDPVLTGKIGVAMVNGIESHGVGTSVKHYVANNQETERMINDARISERAMREIYLKGFEIIVRESQPWTIMSSYNKVNGEYVAESRYLLTDVLRGEWDFQGLVMSDWFGGSNPPAMVRAGNDLLEPGTKNQLKALKKAAERGELSQEDIDTSVKRILKLILNSRKMEAYAISNDPDLDTHAGITRSSAAEGMVLLKNEKTLPLGSGLNVALFGTTSFDFIAGGTGSGDVNEAYTISLEQGLVNSGFQINRASKKAFEEHKSAHAEAFEKPGNTFQAMTTVYSPPELIPSEDVLSECVKTSDLAIITIGRNSGEGGDRVEKDDFLLKADEQEMIKKVCQAYRDAGKKVVVVMNIGGVIETASWKEQPDAILLAWQGGQEGGNSVADILAGKLNPSGKLPMTFPLSLHDHASTKNFPLEGGHINLSSIFDREEKAVEEQVANYDYTNYEEGIYVGYRHFDKAGLEVSYPFGYGLSYTSFSYDNMEVNLNEDVMDITVQVSNAGDKAGKEVVEIYLSKENTAIDRPLRELRAFSKTALLQPDETATLTMSFPVSELSHWDEEKDGWALEQGLYTVHAASSSRDIRLSQSIEISE